MKQVNLQFIGVREGLHRMNEFYLLDKLTNTKLMTQCDCQVMITKKQLKEENIEGAKQVLEHVPSIVNTLSETKPQ